MTAERERIAAMLSEDLATVSARITDDTPWLCTELNIDWRSWSKDLLASHNLNRATLHLIGSAALGFSLSPEKAGRPFRKTGGVETPSDLDLAIVDNALFHSCWDEMVTLERNVRTSQLSQTDREHVYWGRIDDHRVPQRTNARTTVRTLIDKFRRAPEFRGYPASLRVYRRRDDLFHYVFRGLQFLGRTST